MPNFIKVLPNTLLLAFAIIISIWAGYVYKICEPTYFPVVVDFAIHEIVQEEGEPLLISGSMRKVRGCEYVDLVAYSRHRLIEVDFREEHDPVNRVTGYQYWGYWSVEPRVDHITIYVRHMCTTGRVVTKMYDGKMKTTPSPKFSNGV